MSGWLLLGGSFDPIHHGHLIIARAAAEHLAVERVVLIPSAHPPHKQAGQLASAAARVEMCRRAAAGQALFEVSDWELRQHGPNFTLYTVRHYRETLPAATPLYWLIGADSLHELHTWHRATELVEACTIVTAGRPGFVPDWATLRETFSPEQISRLADYVLDTPLIAIQAREIRARVQAGASIRYLVPEAVEQYIRQQGLYQKAGSP